MNGGVKQPDDLAFESGAKKKEPSPLLKDIQDVSYLI